MVQVNADLLARLLRPVPFVAGLPAPCLIPATARETTPGSHDLSSNCAGVEANGAIELDDAPSETGTPDCCDGRREQGNDDVPGDAERGREDASCTRDADETTVSGLMAPVFSEPKVVGAPEHERVIRAAGAGSGHDGEVNDDLRDVEVLERRAAPFLQGPAATLAKALDSIANGGSARPDKEANGKSAGRAEFYSYDETHQVRSSSYVSSVACVTRQG